jgi:mRNA interferase RelE/StbE
VSYEIELTSEARRPLNRLPEKVRDVAIALMLGPMSENPQRVGKPLVGQLEGMRSARRGDFRVIYEIEDDTRTVVVLRVQHRGDVYRPR